VSQGKHRIHGTDRRGSGERLHGHGFPASSIGCLHSGSNEKKEPNRSGQQQTPQQRRNRRKRRRGSREGGQGCGSGGGTRGGRRKGGTDCNKQSRTEDGSIAVQSVTAPGRPRMASHARRALLPPSVGATPPSLPPSETVHRQRARSTPRASLRPKHSAANVRAGGGEVRALSRRS
jgi:hypothetical protein